MLIARLLAVNVITTVMGKRAIASASSLDTQLE